MITITAVDTDLTDNSAVVGVTTNDTVRCGLATGDTSGNLECIAVTRTDSNHPNAGTFQGTRRYWTITPTLSGGSGYTLTLQLPHFEAPTPQDEVCRYTGTGTMLDCASNGHDTVSIYRTGVVTLSD